MMNLVGGDRISLITSAASDIQVHATWVLSDTAVTGVTLNRTNTTIASAVTTVVVATVVTGNDCNVKYLSVYNNDASTTNTVTVQHNGNVNANLFKIALAPGETLLFREGYWFHYDSGGGVYSSPTFTTAQLLTSAEPSNHQRIFTSNLPQRSFGTGSITLTSNTGYFVYLGRAVAAFTVNRVECHMTSIATGSNTGEVGIFTSPLPPNRSNQTLTKLIVNATLNPSVTLAAAVIGNNTLFAQAIAVGTHLWAAIRCATGTTGPSFRALEGDTSEGMVLTAAAVGALTGVTTVSGVIPSLGTGALAPDLRMTLD